MSPELPVIKIVQPIEQYEGKFDPSEDIDPRDEMLYAFLTPPATIGNYGMFVVKQTFNHPFGENVASTHWITTIGPVPENQVLYKLRHMVLNRFVPYDTIVTLNSMNPERLLEYFAPHPDKNEIYFDGAEKYQKIHEFFNWIDTLEYAPEKNFEETPPR